LSRITLEDTGVPAPMEIMMVRLPEDICLFVCSPQSPGDTWQLQCYPAPEGGCWSSNDTWWPRTCPSRGGTWWPWRCPELGAGARAVGARGGPELPRAGSRSLSHGDTWRPQSCPHPGGGSHCLDLKLVRGVPGPQGTDSGPRDYPGRGCEPAGGANILSTCSLSESLCVGILKRWCSTYDTW
jgi:hypothetical protein